MFKPILVWIITLVAASVMSSLAFAQELTEPVPPGWHLCPRCQTPKQRVEAEKLKPKDHPFNPHDLSGVWGGVSAGGVFRLGEQSAFTTKDQGGRSEGTPPPMTPFGKERYNATLTEEAPDGGPVSNSKDPMLICDPLGWPRLFTYNYGFEIITLPDRVLQNFVWGNAWRTIWTDGRKLPENPPELRFMGWAVGHWDGDTFVVESNGYDDRSWLNEDFPVRKNGFTHSDQMRIEERWKRTSYGTIEAQLTVIDPKTYTQPWKTDVHEFSLLPNTEIWEYFCVPSDSADFNRRVLRPATGAK